jgi:hypothetical protein
MASTSVAAAGSGEEGIMCKHAYEASSAPRGAPTPGARVAVRPGRRPDADERLLRPAAPPATGTVRPGIGAAAARFVAGRLAEVLGQPADGLGCGRRAASRAGAAPPRRPRLDTASRPGGSRDSGDGPRPRGYTPWGPRCVSFTTRSAAPAAAMRRRRAHGARETAHGVAGTAPSGSPSTFRWASWADWADGSGRKSGLQGPACVACQPVMPRRRSRSGQCLTRPHGGPRRCDSGLRSEWWDREVQILSPRPYPPIEHVNSGPNASTKP